MKCGILLIQKKQAVGSSKPWIVLQEKLSHGSLGRRSTATFRKLYSNVCHKAECLFFTDDWPAFAKILPKDRHVIGKYGTVVIEQDNRENDKKNKGGF